MAIAALCALWLVLIVPSLGIPFRVEQWDIYDHYASRAWDFTRLTDWLHVAFWTPFEDYRFIPLAYLWNFTLFAALGASHEAHWSASIGLNVVNAVLLARWVDALLGERRSVGGAVAAAAFLFSAPRQEVVMWTFFTYKLAASAVMLLALVAFEVYMSRGRTRLLGYAVVMIFLSGAMYEAAIPLLAVFWGRLALRRGEALGRFGGETLMIGSLGLVYGLLVTLASRVVPGLIGLSSPLGMPHSPVSLRSLLLSAEWWALWGVVLPGIGLPIEWRSADTYIAYAVVPGPWDIARCCAPALLLIIGMFGRTLPWRRAGVVASSAAATALLVYLGRTFTNGESYLCEFGMYQHLPELFASAGLGVLVSGALSSTGGGGGDGGGVSR